MGTSAGQKREFGGVALAVLMLAIVVFLWLLFAAFTALDATAAGPSYSYPRAKGVSTSVNQPLAGGGGGGGGGSGDGEVLVDFEVGADGDAVKTNGTAGDALLTNATSIGTTLGIWNITTNNGAGGLVNVASNIGLKISSFAKRGTRSFRFAGTNNLSLIRFDMFNDYSKVSWGYWFFLDTLFNGLEFGSHDFDDARSSGGVYAINNVDDQPGNIVAGAHAPSDVGTGFAITTNRWYYVMKLWDSATSGFLLRYYESNGVVVGTSSNNISAVDLKEYRFGRCDGHGKFWAGFGYIDHIEIDTNGVFPFTPAGGFDP